MPQRKPKQLKNILLTHFKIQDYGGIINYSECLAKGLKQLGCNVNAVMLKNSGITKYDIDMDLPDTTNDRTKEHGSGLHAVTHQKSGFKGITEINYRSHFDQYLHLVKDIDLVIHIVPVPTCSKATKDDNYWFKIFEETQCTQLAVVHDGNMPKLYPHICSISDTLNGIITVHECAYNTVMQNLNTPCEFIPNPHSISSLHSNKITPIDQRDDAIISLQTFKSWKHVDDLIRAIPFMDSFTEKWIFGGGIEYHYMTSENKTKSKYIDKDGIKIWDKAIENNMEYFGYVNTKVRDSYLSKAKLLIDPSWSLTYSKYGSHFNRVMVEAMVKGCVPVCTDLGMVNSTWAKPYINYLEIPHNASPKQYANFIETWLQDEDLLQTIQNNNLQMVKVFDEKTIAKRILDFANKPYEQRNVELSQDFVNAAQRKLEHFGEF